MDVNLPITLYPGRLKLLLLLSGSILLIAGAIWAGYADHTGSYVRNAFVAACVVIVLVSTRVTSLHINATGFRIWTLFRAYNVLWSDVAEFSTAPYGRGRVVLFKYSQSYKGDSKTLSPLTMLTTRRFSASRMSDAWTEYDAALPDNYGMDPGSLAGLMNDLRKRSVAA